MKEPEGLVAACVGQRSDLKQTSNMNESSKLVRLSVSLLQYAFVYSVSAWRSARVCKELSLRFIWIGLDWIKSTIIKSMVMSFSPRFLETVQLRIRDLQSFPGTVYCHYCCVCVICSVCKEFFLRLHL